MLRKVFLGLAAILVVLVIVIATRPADFRISRKAVLAAPQATVFAQVNDMHRWQEWSPWAKLDPNCKITYSGPAAGKGAAFAWAGTNEVGEGKMTIVESQPSELVRFRLEFIKPFAATNVSEFVFAPKGTDQTEVTWTMSGQNGFLGKAISLFMDCDKMLGPQFEKGLAQLETVAKAAK